MRSLLPVLSLCNSDYNRWWWPDAPGATRRVPQTADWIVYNWASEVSECSLLSIPSACLWRGRQPVVGFCTSNNYEYILLLDVSPTMWTSSVTSGGYPQSSRSSPIIRYSLTAGRPIALFLLSNWLKNMIFNNPSEFRIVYTLVNSPRSSFFLEKYCRSHLLFSLSLTISKCSSAPI